jgi:peroxiredoxin Q/BCP
VAVKTFVWLSFALSLMPLPVLAQTDDAKSSPPPSVSSGPATHDMPTGQLRVAGNVHVGQTAPDFTAVSTSGREVTLSRLRGDWIVLLFATDREDFGALRAVYDPATSYGARLLGICKEKIQRQRSYVESEALPFELLADDTGEISSVYGYYALEQRATTPGFVVLDRRGVVRLALQGDVPPQQIIELVHFVILGH